MTCTFGLCQSVCSLINQMTNPILSRMDAWMRQSVLIIEQQNHEYQARTKTHYYYTVYGYKIHNFRNT